MSEETRFEYYKRTDKYLREDNKYIYFMRTALGGNGTFPTGFTHEVKMKKTIKYKIMNAIGVIKINHDWWIINGTTIRGNDCRW